MEDIKEWGKKLNEDKKIMEILEKIKNNKKMLILLIIILTFISIILFFYYVDLS